VSRPHPDALIAWPDTGRRGDRDVAGTFDPAWLPRG
jgi:hypothetical protein